VLIFTHVEMIDCRMGARCAQDHPSQYRQVQEIAENRERSDEAGNGNAPARRGGGEADAVAVKDG
jgi:hypothetical protein